MFGIFRREPPVSVKQEIDKAGENGYRISFLEIPREAQEALTQSAEENRIKDGAKIVEVDSEVLKKPDLDDNGNERAVVYKLRCTTFGERKLNYNLCIKQGPSGEILSKYVEVGE